jgi:hypothetical protein
MIQSISVYAKIKNFVPPTPYFKNEQQEQTTDAYLKEAYLPGLKNLENIRVP